MPICPENRAKYPGGSPTSRTWKDLVTWLRLRSGDRCEGTPQFPNCRAENGKPHPETGSKVVLTAAHMEHDLSRNGPDDLRHLCQRCHNAWDAPVRAQNRKRRQVAKERRTHRALSLEIAGFAACGEGEP